MGACEVGACELGVCEVGACEVGACEVGACEVGQGCVCGIPLMRTGSLDVRLRIPPQVTMYVCRL